LSGLYQRALEYIHAQRQLRLVRPGEIDDSDTRDISPDDREKIFKQINEEVERNRRVIHPDTFDDFRPKKRGGVLPLMLNVAALMLIAGGAWWLLQYFDRSEATIVTNRAGIQSAEGMLLEALKEESEQRLSEKERAIGDIQLRLEEMSEEREQLEANAETRIREREAELVAAMEEELALERSRLKDQGATEADIEKEMAAFEARQRSTFQNELDGVREEAAAEIERQKATLDQLSNEYSEALLDAENDKLQLQEEMTRQQATLLAEFEQKEAALESDRLEALQELESMRNLQERERLVLDQILSFYESVRVNLSVGNLDTALQRLGELRRYLNQSDVISLQGVRERRQVEVFLIDSLEDLIEEQNEGESPDTLSLIRSAEMLAVATTLVEEGNDKYLNADYSDAQRLYISALKEIPAFNVGYERLKSIEERVAQTQASEIGAIMSNANTAYVSGEYARAVALYGDALELIPPTSASGDRVLDQLTAAGFQLNRETDLTVIRDLQDLVARQSTDLDRLDALYAELARLVPDLEAEIEDLDEERLVLGEANQTLEEAAQEQQERAAFLESEIRRLETEAEGDAKKLLTMDSLLAEVERLSVFEEEAKRIPALEQEIARLSSYEEEAQRLVGVEEAIERLTVELDDLKSREAQLQVAGMGLTAEVARLEPYEESYLQRQELLADLLALRTKYQEDTSTGQQNNEPSVLLEHLEAKLLLKRIVDSEPVRSQYPDLYDKIEGYLEALLDEKEKDTRVATIVNINKMMDTVLRSGPRAVSIASTLADSSEREAILGFMDRLQKLLEGQVVPASD
jgi:hypothetical protein